MERYIATLVLFICLSVGFISTDKKQECDNGKKKIVVIQKEEREIKARLVIKIGNNFIPYSDWMSEGEVFDLWRDSDQGDNIKIEYDKIYHCY